MDTWMESHINSKDKDERWVTSYSQACSASHKFWGSRKFWATGHKFWGAVAYMTMHIMKY